MYTKKSLYRLYRPKKFNEVVGHEYVKQILTRQIENGNFSHAILLSGQRGTGKTSIAKIFAKTINCEKLNGFESCEQCDSCLEANRNSHSDIFEIDAASNNGIDEIRNIKNNVVTLPIFSKYKVYIIDEVHMLTTSAFNALLKTLEEPPKHIIFILATTDFNKIPLTIISRCQTFNFARINKEDLISKIKLIAQEEKIQIDEDSLNEIYYLSDGSLRDAINTLEQASSFSNGIITADIFKKVFSIATKTEKLNIIKHTINGDFEYIINFFEEAEKQSLNFKNITLSLIDFLREIIEFKLTNKLKNSPLLTKEEQQIFKNINLETLFNFTDQLVNVYEKTKSSIIDSRYLLISILKASKFSNNISLEEEKIETEKQDSIQEGVVEQPNNSEELTNTSTIEYLKVNQDEKTKELEEETIETKKQDSIQEGVVEQPNNSEELTNTSTIEYLKVNQDEKTKELEEETIETKKQDSIQEGVVEQPNNSEELTNTSTIEYLKVNQDEKTKELEEETIELSSNEIDFNKYKLDFIEQYDTSKCKNVFFSTEILYASTKKSSKSSRLSLQEKINELFDINNENFDLNLAKELIMFYDVKLISVNDDAIVICEKDSISAKILNNELLNEQKRTKMFGYLDREYAFVVLNENQLDLLKEEFKNKWPNLKDKNYEIDLDSFYFDIIENNEIDEFEKSISSLFIDNEIKVVD
ncbi:DNA polymerase III subunit gamma/tau [Spiroplasma endosymbiont of Crioceris asparagi]|uniref:DNA polymerase III subunit gamma/tau n=1 Tax=Spiroplasma endosymbiont of Crioceris asparagi TaxID=3066286 RepID=UPI0030D1C1DC